MMVGSILLNFWAAFAAFTIYFLVTFQSPSTPVTILTGAFIVAIAGFVMMYLLRYLIGYILYTPEMGIEEKDTTEDLENAQDHDNITQNSQQKTRASNSNEIDSEEIAQVVRTMMSS